MTTRRVRECFFFFCVCECVCVLFWGMGGLGGGGRRSGNEGEGTTRESRSCPCFGPPSFLAPRRAEERGTERDDDDDSFS